AADVRRPAVRTKRHVLHDRRLEERPVNLHGGDTDFQNGEHAESPRKGRRKVEGYVGSKLADEKTAEWELDVDVSRLQVSLPCGEDGRIARGVGGRGGERVCSRLEVSEGHD